MSLDALLKKKSDSEEEIEEFEEEIEKEKPKTKKKPVGITLKGKKSSKSAKPLKTSVKKGSKAKVSVSSSTPTKAKKTPTKESEAVIYAFFGIQGSGKTHASQSFSRIGRQLYLDGERKAHIVKKYKYPDAQIDIEVFRMIDKKRRIDKLATVDEFIRNTDRWLELIDSGKYSSVVIANCSIFRPYAKYIWLRKNPKREKPLTFEWGDIEEIVQEILFPFITTCQDNDVHLILEYSIKDKYLNDIIVGTTEDAKQWLLREINVELWFEWDYKKYCIKHPHKPFWEYKDEEEYLADYILDTDFINEQVKFKEYQQFKEETLISESKRDKIKKTRKSKGIQLGQ